MSHSTVLVVARQAADTDDALDQMHRSLLPFDEDREGPPHLEVCEDKDVDQAVQFFRDNPEARDGEGGPGPLSSSESWRARCVGSYWGNDPTRGHYNPTTQQFGYYTTFAQNEWVLISDDGKQVAESVVRQSQPPPAPSGHQWGLVGGARWDWFQLGGRWRNFFQLKKGRSGLSGEPGVSSFADLARKGDIDFDTMRCAARVQADLEYDKYEKATHGIEPGRPWLEHLLATAKAKYPDITSLENLRESDHEAHKEVINEARETYHAHPWIVALREADLLPFLADPHKEWAGDRTTYVQRAIDNCGATFAILLDGVWYERATMGWFGMTHNEKEEGSWAHSRAELLDSLPDDCWFGVFDVHI